VIDPAVQAAAVASVVAAGATVSGYLLNQSRARRERRATAFANALAAIRDYENFPFTVWRRTADDAATRDRLWEVQSRDGSAVRRHRVWLKIESPMVGEAYDRLWRVVRHARAINLSLAWSSPPRTSDQLMIGEPLGFVREPGLAETELCIQAMRNELSLIPTLRRPHLRRRLDQQQRRADTVDDPDTT
jgi:hypothetical protein